MTVMWGNAPRGKVSMDLRAWITTLFARRDVVTADTAAFPVAVFWRSVCSLKQPVLLIKDGLHIIAATEEAHELFGSRNVAEICALLKGGIDAHTLNRIQLAIANPVSIVTEMPVRMQNPGLYVNVSLTVSTLPEYPEPHAALLFLKDNRNPAVPIWAKTSRDLLSRIPYPAWVVDGTNHVVFSNAAYPQFPMHLVRAQATGENQYQDRVLHDELSKLTHDFRAQPAVVRNTFAVVDQDYDLGPFGQWRITHFPLKKDGGDRMVGVLAMPLQCIVNVSPAPEAVGDVTPMGQDALTHVLQVREAERTALAREVHDSLGQELTVLKLEMRRLYNMMVETATGTPTILEHFKSVRVLVDNLAKTARRIAYEMRQDLATVQGLSHTVQHLVLDLRDRMGIQIQLELMPGWVEPEHGMAHNMHRSLQEMLNNVSKHAKATRCLVRMGLTSGTYWLEVRDDGVGMPPDLTTRSIGLRSMNERAALYEGQVTIESRPAVDGTLVRMELPERRVLGSARNQGVNGEGPAAAAPGEKQLRTE